MSTPLIDVFEFNRHHSDVFTHSHSDLLSKRFLPTVGTRFRLFSNCELDHVFHSDTVSPELCLLGSAQFNIKTVHPYLIHCSFDLSVEAELHEGLGRFHLEYLEKPGVSDRLAQTWTRLDWMLNWNITDPDVYDSILSNSIQVAAEQVLGIYDVLNKRKSPDKVQPLYNSQLSALAAIRLFKRKQRALNPNLRIQALNSSPMEECTAKFHSTFFKADVQVDLPPLDDSDDALQPMVPPRTFVLSLNSIQRIKLVASIPSIPSSSKLSLPHDCFPDFRDSIDYVFKSVRLLVNGTFASCIFYPRNRSLPSPVIPSVPSAFCPCSDGYSKVYFYPSLPIQNIPSLDSILLKPVFERAIPPSLRPPFVIMPSLRNPSNSLSFWISNPPMMSPCPVML